MKCKAVKIIIFLLSLLLIIHFTLLFRHQYPAPRYELQLFWSYRAAKYYPYLRREIFLNYVLYVPFGFSLGLMWPRMKCWQVLLISFLLSASIETMQLLFRIGLFEFDDIWGNTIGGLIGFLVYKGLFNLITRKK